ncbi:MAG TPA: response regulator [Tepidisphaeraceae bacterium]|jgi:DNA-binding response OmpR family regulator
MDSHGFDVLVVEDDSTINSLIGAYVELAGMTYRRALDGREAVRQTQQKVPQAIILDVMLPDTDGFQICRQMKQDFRTQGVPVVMLTALTDEASRQRGVDSGADEYLHKPFDPDRLLEVLKVLAARNGRLA